MFEPSRQAQVGSKMSRYNLDILGLCETGWKKRGDFPTQNGTTVYKVYFVYSGNDIDRTREVGLLISRHARRSLIEYKPISDRLIMARFHSKFCNIFIFMFYAPTEVDKDVNKDSFYDLLYGCETWKVSESLCRKLQVFDNKCLRQILKIFWPERISNLHLLQRAQQQPLAAEVKLCKWRWISHTLRKADTDQSVQRLGLIWPQLKRLA